MAASQAVPAGRGRKSVPRGLKLVQGRAPGKDSGGRPVPAEVPFVRGPLPKPEALSPDASWLWDMVIEQMTTIGLLKPLDAASLEALCECFSRMREAVRMRQLSGLSGHNSQGVVTGWWIGIEERAAKEFRGWCAEYGLTPAAEKNLRTGEDNAGITENPFQ